MKTVTKTSLVGAVIIVGGTSVVSLDDQVTEGTREGVYTVIDATNNQVAELKTTNTAAQNRDALQSLLAYRKKYRDYQTTITLPKGTYKLAAPSGAFELVDNTVLKMNSQAKLKLYGDVIFAGVPTGKRTVDGLSNFEWSGGQLVGNGKQNTASFLIVHGQKLVFDRLMLQRVAAYNEHVFDLNGVHSVKITNSKFIGYGTGDLADAPKDSMYHASVAEAVQLDTANFGSSYGSRQKQALTNLQPKLEAYSSNFGSDLVVVQRNEFLPYVVSDKRVSPAQAPIGTHAYKEVASPTKQVVFMDNVIDNPQIPLTKVGDGEHDYDNNYPGPVHFTGVQKVDIVRNTFRKLASDKPLVAWISNYQNADRFGVQSFTVNDNKFEGVAPEKAIVMLISSLKTSPTNGNGIIQSADISNNTLAPNVQNVVSSDKKVSMPVAVFIKDNQESGVAQLHFTDNVN